MRQKKPIFSAGSLWRKGLIFWVITSIAIRCTVSASAWYAYTVTSRGHAITPGYYHAELYWSDQPEGVYTTVDEETPFSPTENPFYLRVISTADSSAAFGYRLTATSEGTPCVIKPWGKEGEDQENQNILTACSPGETHTYQVERRGKNALVTVGFSTHFTNPENLGASS